MRISDLSSDVCSSDLAFACNGEPISVMMATPEDLEDFAFGFALAEGIVASADEVVIDSIETSLEGVAIALSIPSDRASVLEARRRSLEGCSGCGICGMAQVEAVLRPPPPVGTGTVITTDAPNRALRELQGRQPLNALTGATHEKGSAPCRERGCQYLSHPVVHRTITKNKLAQTRKN